jgi:hypothetical protein
MKPSRVCIVALMLVLLIAGCQAEATPQPTASPTPESSVQVELIGLDGATKVLSLSDLYALPPTEGWGGLMSSTGRISPPSRFKGVSVEELCTSMGGLQPGTGVRIVAEDGYAMTVSYDQIVNGDFIVYDPGTGEETTTDSKLQVVIAYEQDGEALSEREDGSLRMALLSDDKTQVTDGHWWVKWVRQVAIKSLAEDWVLHLEGTLVEEMDRSTFESGASPNCHQATWTDDHAQTWTGVPLWLMVGRVDDDNKHDDEAFDRELADAGYTVDVVAADGYTVSFDSQRVKENNDIILAHLMNENPLDEEYFPLRLVGSNLEKSEMVGQVTQIIVHLP